MKNEKHKMNMIIGNSGSAVVSVVVAMVFVLALGAALLFATYTAYSVSVTQRMSKENFYSASSAADDIRLGIQTILSDAIADAYTEVLADYVGVHPVGYDPQIDFNNNIVANLISKTVTVDGLSAPVFRSGIDVNGNTVISGYNARALKAFIDPAEYANSTVTDAKENDGDSVDGNDFEGGASSSFKDGVLQSIDLDSIAVKYIENDYETNITTDIVITMPYFFASSSVTSGINNYAIIANHQLISTGISNNISGSVFAGDGGILVQNSGSVLSFDDGDLISKGVINLEAGAAFNFAATQNQLWCEGITLGSGSLTSLDGAVYVADDLTLAGDAGKATLKNTYFGFGNRTDNSEGSSSIVVNGRNCELDISGLSKLSLAGISFIKTVSSDVALQDKDSNTYISDIPMGQSMTIKPDQLAYLVPMKCISNYATNPCVFPVDATTEEITPKIDKDIVLWGDSGNEKTLSNYIDGGKGSTLALYKNTGDGYKIAYVFLVFNDKAYANEYFKDYFAADPSKIEQYMDTYLSLSDKADDAKINTAGNTFYTDDNSTASTEDDKLTLNPASESVYADGAQLLYNKMYSPYLVFVNTVKLAEVTGTDPLVFTDEITGDAVAVVSIGAYSYESGSANTIQLIISPQNVTVNKSFNGIIISQANVTVKADITGKLLSSAVLNSTCTAADGTEYKLSDFLNNSAQIQGNSGLSQDLWDLNTLVSYSNWKKN